MEATSSSPDISSLLRSVLEVMYFITQLRCRGPDWSALPSGMVKSR